jgi:hypothetical protein
MSENLSPTAAAGTAAGEKINLVYHLIIGVAVGIVTPFTGLAWPVAMVMGYLIGRDQVERSHGFKAPAATSMLRALLVVIGFIAMLVLGAIIGAFIALLIVALVAFSERVAANASTTDQGIARILVFVVGALIWVVAFFVLKLNVNINVGG